MPPPLNKVQKAAIAKAKAAEAKVKADTAAVTDAAKNPGESKATKIKK